MLTHLRSPRSAPHPFEAALRNAGAPVTLVSEVTYDARGQRVAIVYGSGVTTTHTHSSATGREHTGAARRAAWFGPCAQRGMPYDPDGKLRADTQSYAYDAAGTRIRKVVEQYIGGDWVHKCDVLYLGGFELQHTFSGTTLWTERETLHAHDGDRRLALVETKTVDDGDPVATPTPLLRYQLDNHLRSATVETSATGAVISYEEFHPYGTTAYHAADATLDPIPKRYRYSGKEKDAETGLYYYGARYLAPWLGRWVSTDPAGFVDGPNVYAFVKGRPSAAFVPNGLSGLTGPLVDLSGNESMNPWDSTATSRPPTASTGATTAAPSSQHSTAARSNAGRADAIGATGQIFGTSVGAGWTSAQMFDRYARTIAMDPTPLLTELTDEFATLSTRPSAATESLKRADSNHFIVEFFADEAPDYTPARLQETAFAVEEVGAAVASTRNAIARNQSAAQAAETLTSTPGLSNVVNAVRTATTGATTLGPLIEIGGSRPASIVGLAGAGLQLAGVESLTLDATVDVLGSIEPIGAAIGAFTGAASSAVSGYHYGPEATVESRVRGAYGPLAQGLAIFTALITNDHNVLQPLTSDEATEGQFGWMVSLGNRIGNLVPVW